MLIWFRYLLSSAVARSWLLVHHFENFDYQNVLGIFLWETYKAWVEAVIRFALFFPISRVTVYFRSLSFEYYDLNCTGSVNILFNFTWLLDCAYEYSRIVCMCVLYSSHKLNTSKFPWWALLGSRIISSCSLLHCRYYHLKLD